jgi:hypothetical protein
LLFSVRLIGCAADLCKAQQAMSRKKKFSNSWKKAKAKVQSIHVRIANARRDFLHKTSTAISKNHAMVVTEDLQVSNMSRSAAGTVEQPGRKVRLKSMCGMWLRGERQPGRSHQCSKGGTRPVSQSSEQRIDIHPFLSELADTYGRGRGGCQRGKQKEIK